MIDITAPWYNSAMKKLKKIGFSPETRSLRVSIIDV